MKLENLRYSDIDPRCLLDINLPDGVEAPPLYVYFHGGGLRKGHKTLIEPFGDFLVSRGIAYASVEYRMYPDAAFPDYLVDAANAAAFLTRGSETLPAFKKVCLGGSSAGAYITMMLFFNKAYLTEAGADFSAIKGYVFDAGQPTSHFEYLKTELGVDYRRIVIDRGAPLFYLTEDFTGDQPEIAIMYSEHDMYNRPEQTQLLYRTMLHFRFPEEKLHLIYYPGESHTSYLAKDFYMEDLYSLITKATL